MAEKEVAVDNRKEKRLVRWKKRRSGGAPTFEQLDFTKEPDQQRLESRPEIPSTPSGRPKT